MPLIDKPLAELRHYTGTNPRPADFEAYWRQALDELDATPPRAEFVRTPVITPAGAEAFDLWFTGVGGARIHAKYLRPGSNSAGGSGPHPAILQFHGYAQHSGDWTDKLAWVNEGFCIAAMDCRGQGGQSDDVGGAQGNTHLGHIVRGLEDPDPHKLLFRSIYLDTVQLARVVMALPEVDGGRLASFGGSQGGGLALACAALEPRIQRVASVYPFLCDFQRVWEMDLAQDAYVELRHHFRLRDPLHLRESDTFTRLGYIDIQHLAPRIQAEVLMFTGLMDTVCPPSTQFAAYNKITAAKNVVIYPDFGHENLPGVVDHTLNFLQGRARDQSVSMP